MGKTYRRRILQDILFGSFIAVILVNVGILIAKFVFDAQQFEPELTGCIPSELIEREIEYTGTVYLTFDDGPGDHTNWLLDILKMYNVSATFFVTGNGDDATIAREYREGHAIGLHTLSHKYSYIYRNVDNFFDDLYAVQDRVRAITGETSMLMRFPGGSSNTVSRRYDGGKHIMSTLTWEVENRGFTYFDWNILSGDAGETTDTGEIVARVTSALHPGENVVLQHDVKDYSVAAVEEIIKFGKNNGYKFEKLTNKSFTAHHGVNN